MNVVTGAVAVALHTGVVLVVRLQFSAVQHLLLFEFEVMKVNDGNYVK